MKPKSFRRHKQLNDLNKLFSYACWWLTRYPSSTLKLKDRLMKKCRDLETIEKVITRLIRLNYLNDNRLAKNLVKHYIEMGYGKIVILKKLKEKGILDNKFIENAWNENSKDEDELERILNLIKKRAERYNLDKERGKKSLMDFLLRRGFKYNDVLDAFRQSHIL